MTVPAIGELRHRVTIEQPVRTDDEAGAALITWQPLATVWARIEARAGRENIRADTPIARTATEIIIRYRNDVDATMRIDHDGTLYEITAAFDDDGRRRWLTCHCIAFGP